jgi:hypothetical protein
MGPLYNEKVVDKPRYFAYIDRVRKQRRYGMSTMDLKPLVDETLALAAAKAAGTSDEELQPRFHELLTAMAYAVDRDEMNRHSDDTFRAAVAELRRHSFVRFYDGPEEINEMEEVRKALGWPPVLPRVALIVNLVRYLLIEGNLRLVFNYSYMPVFASTSSGERPATEDRRYRYGWHAFYDVFGEIIRAA